MSRRAKGEKQKSLYKVLETTANISQARIREKYVAQIRKFPPETHPKEFQEIRRAYEILRDPETRRTYDASRRGVRSDHEVIAEVDTLFARRDFSKAIRVLKEHLPHTADVRLHLLLVRAYEENGDPLEAMTELDSIRANVRPEDRHVMLTIEIHLLVGLKSLTEAENRLKAFSASELYEKESLAKAAIFLAEALVDENDHERAWKLFQDLLPLPKEHVPYDGPLLLALVWLIGYCEYWDRKSEVTQRIRCWGKLSLDDDILGWMKTETLGDIEIYWSDGSLREVDLLCEIMMQIDPKDEMHRRWVKRSREAQKAFKELLRLRKDREVFDGLKEMVDIWFARHLGQFGVLEESDPRLLNLEFQLGLFGFPEMTDLHFTVTNGIHRIRKQFPDLFNLLRADMEEMLADCSVSLTRKEQRLAKREMRWPL